MKRKHFVKVEEHRPAHDSYNWGSNEGEEIKALARKEWERLKAALELKCHDFMVKKDLNQIEFMAPGKKMTFTFESDATRLGNEPCSLEARTTRDVTQYLFRLSEDKT